MGEDTGAPLRAFIAELHRFETLPAIERARIGPDLISHAKAAISAARDAAIAEAVDKYQSGGLSRGGAAEVSRQLGLSQSKISEALKRVPGRNA